MNFTLLPSRAARVPLDVPINVARTNAGIASLSFRAGRGVAVDVPIDGGRSSGRNASLPCPSFPNSVWERPHPRQLRCRISLHPLHVFLLESPLPGETP
jgi:hypothetical protein